MFEDHERAAMMPNEGNITWHYFIRSRFIGELKKGRERTFLAIDIQTVSLESPLHVDLRGLLEYSTGSALPVVFEITGTVNLENRDVRIDDALSNAPEKSYAGSFSENGRVLSLRSLAPERAHAKPLLLVHEGTLRELYEE